MALFIFAFCLVMLLGIIQLAVSRGHRELRPLVGFGWLLLVGMVLPFLIAMVLAN